MDAAVGGRGMTFLEESAEQTGIAYIQETRATIAARRRVYQEFHPALAGININTLVTYLDERAAAYASLEDPFVNNPEYEQHLSHCPICSSYYEAQTQSQGELETLLEAFA